MSVSQLLATHTSRELAEWQAYELTAGFADPYVIEALADIHEQIQWLSHLTGAAHLTEEDDPESNPSGPPKRYPRRVDRRHKFNFELNEQDNEGYRPVDAGDDDDE